MVYSPSDVISPVGSGRTRRVRGEPRWRRRGFFCAAAAKRFAVVLHDIDADRRGEADTLTTSVDFENHVMDGFAALNRYIVEPIPHRRFQPNAGPMTADPDGAARRRSLADELPRRGGAWAGPITCDGGNRSGRASSRGFRPDCCCPETLQ